MNEVVIFAPTEGILKKAKNIIAKNKYDNVKAVYGNIHDDISSTDKYVTKDTRVIISRGGSYNYYKERFNIPAIEIRVDVYDVIDCYNKLGNTDESIGIIGFTNVIYGFDMINHFIKNKITNIAIQDREEIHNAIKTAMENGINTFMGDTTVRLLSGIHNFHGSVIESREENINVAVNEALLVLSVIKNEERIRSQTEAITDFIHDGIITVDKNMKVTVFNKEAERLLDLRKEEVLGKNIANIFDNIDISDVLESGNPITAKIMTVMNKQMITNFIPIDVNGEILGVVISFIAASEVSVMDHEIRRSLAKHGFVAKYQFKDIIYKSRKMEKCIQTAKQYAQYDTPILVCGKSGVGKEMLCQSIHNLSFRSKGPFVAVNCAAIPSTLFESELFGYEDGAFTGARKNGKAGMFEIAHNGTIFLDEISEIPLEFQGRLLRVLQEKQIMRIGGDKVIPVDVKIICATNKNLDELVNQGKFRDDLFFRINTLNLFIPSLDERREDILILAEYFIKKYSKKYKKQEIEMTERVKDILTAKKYKGNIRELQGMMERCVILNSFDTVTEPEENSPADAGKLSSGEDFTDLHAMTQQYIEKVYLSTNCSTKATCDILKIDRTTLWKRLKKTT
nr:sigma 54-interacting transcriptional regulator [Sedimentibacter sp.]